MSDETYYEDLRPFALSEKGTEALLNAATEATLCWGTKDGSPMGVIMGYVWRDGRIWMTREMQENLHRATAEMRLRAQEQSGVSIVHRTCPEMGLRADLRQSARSHRVARAGDIRRSHSAIRDLDIAGSRANLRIET